MAATARRAGVCAAPQGAHTAEHEPKHRQAAVRRARATRDARRGDRAGIAEG